jgi:hypothetical protein
MTKAKTAKEIREISQLVAEKDELAKLARATICWPAAYEENGGSAAIIVHADMEARSKRLT